MSRIGKKPIPIPEGITVELQPGILKVQGPKGELSQAIHPKVVVVRQDRNILVSVQNPRDKEERSIWGTTAALLKNMIQGVGKGFQKQLEIIGTGYKVNMQGNKLVLSIGFSRDVQYLVPSGVSLAVEKNTITINGADRQLVGEVAAQIRRIRPPDAYKGKGIRYLGEEIRLKPGKQAKTGAAAGS